MAQRGKTQVQRQNYVLYAKGKVNSTFSLHAYSQTLLEAAERTAFPLRKVHRAALLVYTCVVFVILH